MKHRLLFVRADDSKELGGSFKALSRPKMTDRSIPYTQTSKQVNTADVPI